MDKVDAKTRETAVTLLDVLWTSRSAAGAVRSSVTPIVTVTATPPTEEGTNHIDTVPMQVETNNGVLGNTPTTTTLRHGFDTNGWGNDLTVQHQLSTQHIGNKPVSSNNTSNINANHEVDTNAKPQKPEHDTETISQQQSQSQSQSSTNAAASSSASVVPMTTVRKQEHHKKYRNKEKQLEQQQCIEDNQTQQPSTKFEQNSFLGPNSTSFTSSISSNTTTPMMISMTSIGFGIDNNNLSRVDATEAAIKAVRDAMERSTLRFQTFHSHSLQIKIHLGVPSVGTQVSSLRDSDSKSKQDQEKLQPMIVDLARLSTVLPRVIPILPVQVDVGGLFVPGETPAAPSICSAVACITLESQSQSSPLQSQLQPQSSSRASVAPPLPPRPSLAFETSTVGLQKPKQSSSIDVSSTAATRMMHAPTQEEEPQQHHHHQQKACLQMKQKPTNLLPTSAPTAQQQPECDPIAPQQWPRENTNTHDTTRYVSETALLPSSSLLYRTEVKSISTASSSREKHPEKTTIPISSRKYNVAGGSTSVGNKRPHQQQKDKVNKKSPLSAVLHDGNGMTNSIEILAMISEQEINRRSVLGANGTLKATSVATSRAFFPAAPANNPNSGGNKSSTSAEVVVDDSCTTFEGVKTERISRYCKNGDRVMTPASSFAATRHNHIQSIVYDQTSNNGNSNSKNGRKSSDHFTTLGVQKLTNGAENTTNTSTIGTANLTKSASVRHPPHQRNRQSNKLGGSRGGGRTVSYLDYSNEHPLPEERDCWALSTRTTSSPVFPLKLHETLTLIEKDGYDDIIGWLPHGRSFKIHKQKEFTDIILPRYGIVFASSWTSLDD